MCQNCNKTIGALLAAMVDAGNTLGLDEIEGIEPDLRSYLPDFAKFLQLTTSATSPECIELLKNANGPKLFALAAYAAWMMANLDVALEAVHIAVQGRLAAGDLRMLAVLAALKSALPQPRGSKMDPPTEGAIIVEAVMEEKVRRDPLEELIGDLNLGRNRGAPPS